MSDDSTSIDIYIYIIYILYIYYILYIIYYIHTRIHIHMMQRWFWCVMTSSQINLSLGLFWPPAEGMTFSQVYTQQRSRELAPQEPL